MNKLKDREQELVAELEDVRKQIEKNKDERIFRIEDAFSNHRHYIEFADKYIQIKNATHRYYYRNVEKDELNGILQFLDNNRQTISTILNCSRGELIDGEPFYIDDNEFTVSYFIKRGDFVGQYTTRVKHSGEVTIAAYLRRYLDDNKSEILPNGVEYCRYTDYDACEQYSYDIVVADEGEGDEMTDYDYTVALNEVFDKLYITVDGHAKRI